MDPVFLRPGQVVPCSGLYRARHQAHRTPHQVIAIKGERLPLCRTCGRDVSFELVEAADYVLHVRDFRDLLLARS